MSSELMETHRFVLIKSFSINALEFKMKETRSVTNPSLCFFLPGAFVLITPM